MPWQDRYRKASFRGASFLVEASEFEFGRRSIFYDIPMDESGGSATRDMGKLPRRFSITAFVIGLAYDARCDDLIDAIEKPGPGELIHPYYGKVTVIVDGPAKVRETTAEGGMARIEITFRKHRDQPSPDLGLDTLTDASQAADLALEALNEDFVGSFSCSGVQGFVKSASVDVFTDATRTLQSINHDIDSVLGIPSKLASDFTKFVDELEELIDTPQKLINTIQEFVAAMFSGLRRITDAIGSLIPSSNTAATIGDSLGVVSSAATLSRRRQRVNQAASMRAIKGSAIVGAVKASLSLTYDSATQALSVRNTLAGHIEDLLQSSDFDSAELFSDAVTADAWADGDGPQIEEVVKALRKVRVTMNRHLKSVAGDLPAVTTYVPGEMLPTCVIAYQLYGDANRDLEIDARNMDVIKHPAFAPVKVPLEVLSD